MRTDVKKCGGCNRILSLRETCPTCSAKRREVLARAGERPTPPVKTYPSAWENKAPPAYPFDYSYKGSMDARAVLKEAYPESRYAPNAPRQNFITEVNQEEGRITVTALTEAEARDRGFSWSDEPEAYEYRQGTWQEPEPFSPETFCPPGREALRRAGYECLTEARGGGLCARDRDGRAFYGEVPEDRLTGNQAERFLSFAWETMALDAGLDGILAIIEEEDEE